LLGSLSAQFAQLLFTGNSPTGTKASLKHGREPKEWLRSGSVKLFSLRFWFEVERIKYLQTLIKNDWRTHQELNLKPSDP
jgi:hypothetical protein